MYAWFQSHEALVGWSGVVSALMFVGGLVSVPWLVVRIPVDYFRHRHAFFELGETAHPLVRGAAVVLKNVLGIILLLLGIAMLFLPGQGVLTILLGLMFLDFPGKFALERRLILIPAVHGAIDWIRKKSGRPPLNLPENSRCEK